MLYTIVYVVLRFGAPKESTIAVVGKNQKNYGRALYDKKYNAHVLRLSQEEWEGGADQNILKRTTRAAAVYSVRVEVEADSQSAEGLLEAQIDEQKAAIAELQGRIAAITREKEAIAADFETLKLMATQPPPPEPPAAQEPPFAHAEGSQDTAPAGATKPTSDLIAMIEAHGAANSTATETATETPAENSSGEETLSPNGRQATDTLTSEEPGKEPTETDPVREKSEAHDAHVTRLEAMGFPALLEEAKEQNGEGAEIDTGIKTKAGLRTALLDWYDRKP